MPYSGRPALTRPNQLIVDEAISDDNSMATMSPQTAETAGLFLGDSLIVQGKKRQDTILICITSDDIKDGHLQINKAARMKLCVGVGDNVNVRQCLDIKYGKRVHILPFEDSLGGFTGNLFDQYLRPYFLDAYRPVRKGDHFLVRGANGAVEFKIIECDPPQCCIVAHDTVIHTAGDPLKREDERPAIGYDDIGGCQEQVARIREYVELPLCRPQLLQSMGVKPPRGILFVGPCGTGKSLMVEAIATETGAFRFKINAPELVSSVSGEGERRLRMEFEEVKKWDPAIISIERLDAIAPHPDKTTGRNGNFLVSQLEDLMDDISNTRANVMVIGIVNNHNSINPALRRFGQFEIEIPFGLPNQTGRLEILQIHTKNMRIDVDVDLEQIAIETPGYAGSDLARLCSQASIHSIRESMDLIEANEGEALSVAMSHFRLALTTSRPSQQMHHDSQHYGTSDSSQVPSQSNFDLRNAIVSPVSRDHFNFNFLGR